jgi:hypothetical protein
MTFPCEMVHYLNNRKYFVWTSYGYIFKLKLP